MNSTPLFVTVPHGSDRRATPDLYTLQLLSPMAFHPDRWSGTEVYVINPRFGQPTTCFHVRCNGRPITFKRRPELRFPWAYGYPRTSQAAYGHFVSLDGSTWDTTGYNYAPYRLLSILSAAERRALNRKDSK